MQDLIHQVVHNIAMTAAKIFNELGDGNCSSLPQREGGHLQAGNPAFGAPLEHGHLECIDLDPFEDIVEIIVESAGEQHRFLLDGPVSVDVSDPDEPVWILDVRTHEGAARIESRPMCGGAARPVIPGRTPRTGVPQRG